MASRSAPRSIDHLVLPVTQVDDARERYSKLGFTVAPTAQHPFGTENCCIFLPDGTFLEPLGIAQRETCEAAAIDGNTFIRNDQAYRFRVGEEGFSHLVLKSDDATADHELYEKSGMSGGDMVHFSRKFETPDGEAGEIAFNLAFAADQRSPDSGFFSCEVVSSAAPDRAALQTHENGAICLKEVIATEINPTDFQYLLQVFLNQRRMESHSFGMSLQAENAVVSVFTPDGAKAFYGIDAGQSERGMRFKAFIIGVADISALKHRFENQNIVFHVFGESLVVPEDRGQGATIVFEATS